MRKNIHPDYNEVKIKIGKDILITKSCLNKQEYIMDRDFRKHPAWTKKGIAQAETTSSSVNTYKKKYGNLDFL